VIAQRQSPAPTEVEAATRLALRSPDAAAKPAPSQTRHSPSNPRPNRTPAPSANHLAAATSHCRHHQPQGNQRAQCNAQKPPLAARLTGAPMALSSGISHHLQALGEQPESRLALSITQGQQLFLADELPARRSTPNRRGGRVWKTVGRTPRPDF